jgi:hypothetical protein
MRFAVVDLLKCMYKMTGILESSVRIWKGRERVSEATPGSETIDGLTFVPDPAYPYPFRVEVAPHFWMTEQSGVLAGVVEAYFQGEQLTVPQQKILVIYLRQYIERALLLPGVKRELLLQQLVKLRSHRDFEDFADELAAVGIAPF